MSANQMVTYKSVLGTHKITVELDIVRKEALINNIDIEYHSPVELTVLLKNMVNELKKIDIRHIIQQVTKDDWINVLKDDKIFSFINENKIYGFINLKCEIDKFPEAVMKGLGYSNFT